MKPPLLSLPLNRGRLFLLAAILAIAAGLAFGLPATAARADGHGSGSYPTLGPLLTQIVKQEISPFATSSIGGQAEVTGDLLPVSLSVDTADRLAEITTYIEANGGQAGTIFVGKPGDVYGGALAAGVPSSLLPSLAVKPGVAYVRLRIPPQVAQASSPPSVPFPNGPADVTGAAAWHNEGFTGEGVRVGVIDEGFIGFTAKTSARLKTPAQWYCTAEGGNATPYAKDCERRHRHGTDVVDSILMTAPDVSLYLANWCCSTERDEVAEAIAWMLANGVQVINFSGSDSWEGPGDGTSPFLGASVRNIDWAVNNGVTWINSAGNSNGYAWFSDHPAYLDVTVGSETKRLIDFSPPGEPADTCLDVAVAKDESPLLELRWDDRWPGATDDLNLYVYEGTTASGDPFRSSTEAQTGGDESYPFESIRLPKQSNSTVYCLAIESKSGANPDWVNVHDFHRSLCFGVWDDVAKVCDWRFVGHPSIMNPAESANPGMLAVAALGYYQSAGEEPKRFIEHFSSRGPTKDGRVKPDVTGIDRLAADGGYDAPGGTSYSSPSVAGLAALVIGRFGDNSAYDTPAEIASYLKNQAEDLKIYDSEGRLRTGTVGPDNISGYGLVVLPDPDATEPPVLTLHLTATELFENGYGDNAGANSAQVSAHLDKPAASDVTINLSVGSSTAYSLDGTSLTINQGEIYSSGYAILSVSDNSTADGHLTGSVSATVSGGGATIADPEPVDFTVIDDESPPRVRVTLTNPVIREGSSGSDASTRMRIFLDHPVNPTANTTFNLSVPDSGSPDYTLEGIITSVTVFSGTTSATSLAEVSVNDNDTYSGGGPREITVSATTTSSGVGDIQNATLYIIDDEPRPTVKLLVEEYDWGVKLAENGTAANITAELSGPVSEELKIVVSAPTSSHYSLSATNELTIAAGSTASTGTVTITPVNNETDDPDQHFALTATASGGNGVADPEPFLLTIGDDEGDPEVRLWLDYDLVSEEETTVVLDNSAWVYADLGRPAVGDVQVKIAAQPVSPATSSDFELGNPVDPGDSTDPATLTIPDGEAYSFVCHVDDYEGPSCTGRVFIKGSGSGVYNPVEKKVTLSGTVTSGAASNPVDTLTLTIADADFPQVVRLSLSEDSVSEGDTTQVSASLRRPTTAPTTVTVKPREGHYTVSGAGALTIPAGDSTSTGSVTITTVDDGQYLGDRTVAVIATASSSVAGVEDPAPVTLRMAEASEPPPGIPNAPTLDTDGATSDSLSVSWAAPANTGPAITDYDVRYCPTSGSCDNATGADWTIFQPDTADDSTATSATITGLTASTEYYVQVRAENAEGAGAWSASLTASTSADNAEPVISYNGSDAGAGLTFTPEENSSPSYPFTAQDTDTGQTLTWSLAGDTDTFAVDAGTGTVSLQSGASLNYETKTSYSLTLTVEDGAGGSDSVDITVDVQNVIENPGTVAAPTITEVSASSFKVNWTAPDLNNGPPITRFYIHYKGEGDANWNNHYYTGLTPEITISGLRSGTTYQVRVSAQNGEGGGSGWSDITTATTPNDAPIIAGDDSVTIDNVVENTASDLHLFTASDPNGDAIIWSLEDAPASVSITGGQLATTGMNYEAGAAQSFTVVASDGKKVMTNDGTEDARDTVTVTVNVTDDGSSEPPSAPAAPTVAGANPTRLWVGWTEPDNPGPPVTGYDVRYCQDSTGCDDDTKWTDAGHTGAATSITIEVTEDTAYRAQVRATNAEGASGWSDSGTGMPGWSCAANADIDVWCATLVAGTTPNEFIGFTSSAGSLSDKNFSYKGTDYPIIWILDEGTRLELGSTTDVRDSTLRSQLNELVFFINGSSFPVVDAAALQGGVNHYFRWKKSNWTMSSDNSYIVRLAPNSAPVIGGADTVSLTVDENTTEAFHTFTATDTDLTDVITWSLEGTDAASFAIDGGAVSPASTTALDFEGTKTTYSFTVKASDGIDSDTVSVTVTVSDVDEPPGAPDAPEITSTTSNSMTVSWAAPSNTGPAIIDYDVRYCPADRSCDAATGTDWTVFQPDTADDSTVTSARITGLTASTAYSVQVRAENDEGDGAWSASATANTGSPALGFGSATVDNQVWTAGADIGTIALPEASGGTAPLTYSLTPPAGVSFNASELELTGTPTTSQAATSYTYTVTDSATPAATATLTFTIAINPAKPASFTATPGDGQVVLSWTDPSDSGISWYYKQDDGSWTAITPTESSGVLSFTVTGLDNNTAYSFRVVGVPSGETPDTESAASDSINATPDTVERDYDSDDDGLIEIKNLAQLNAVRWDLNGDGTVSSSDETSYAAAFSNAASGMGCPTGSGCVGYELTADLDFDTNDDGEITSDDDYWNGGAGWAPIGPSDASRFTAVFDGGGHAISNLFISRSDNRIGLFGVSTGKLRNLELLNVDVSGGSSSVYVGALVGGNGGSISGVYVDGQVTDAGNNSVGMVTGVNGGRIIASYASGHVTGDGAVGGLAGENGVDRGPTGAIVASYSTAAITTSATTSVGGLVGKVDGEVTDSYWDKDTSGIGRQFGSADTAKTGLVKSADELKSPIGYTGIYANWDNLDLDGDGTADTNALWAFGAESQYPYLVWQGSPPPAPTVKTDYDEDNDGLIDIDSLHRLHAIRWDLDGDGVAILSVPGGDTLDFRDLHRVAFPDPQGDFGCDLTACHGYELTKDLDFDSNGDGTVNSSDDFWANYPWDDDDPWNITSSDAVESYSGTGWEPIAAWPDGYDAVFDGGGHVIRNLYVAAHAPDNSAGSGANNYVGLFGALDPNAVVRDLGLLDASITRTGSTTGTAPYIGGLAGRMAPGSAAIAVRFDGTVEVDSEEDLTSTGGLVGWTDTNSTNGDARIIASYVTGTVTGIATQSDNTKNPDVGGLVGLNDGHIEASYSRAAVTSASADTGGLVGRERDEDGDGAADGTVTDSYWDTQTSGQSVSAGGEGKTTRELQSPTGYTGIYAGWDDLDLDGDSATADTNSLWKFGLSGNYPALWWESVVETGTTDYDADDNGLIEIESLAQLDAIRWDGDGNGAPDNADGVSAYAAAFSDAITGMGCPAAGCKGYELAVDLDFDDKDNSDGSHNSGDPYWNGGAGWEPIGSYNAVFEGNGFSISNFSVSRAIADAGLFGVLGSDADVRGLGLVNIVISTGTATAQGGGALAGANRGAISQVSVEGVSVTTSQQAGGLVGENAGSIATSRVSGATLSSATAGGLAGENLATGNITASYAVADSISATSAGSAGGFVGDNNGSITATYAVTSAFGSDGAIGGFAGGNAGTVTASYWDTTTSGKTGAAGSGSATGITGHTTFDLQSETAYASIYADWDLDLDGDGTADEPWDFLGATDYPQLSWEHSPRVLVSPATLKLNEFGVGNSDTYEVKLATAPTIDTVVTVTVANSAVATASPASLTFTPDNYDTAQDVTITAVNDDVFTTGRATSVANAVTTGDADYLGLSAAVSISVTDDDERGITLNPPSVSVSEDSAAANHSSNYTVKLSSQPSADVTVTVTSEDTTVATISDGTANFDGTLTFTATNWNTAQTLTVTGVNDSALNPGRTTQIKHSAAGGGYDAIVAYVDVSLTDDDSPHFIFTPPSVTVEEGATATYAVHLSATPNDDVAVTIASGNEDVATVSAASMTFTATNWSTPQTVTVSGVENDVDIVADGVTAAISHSASGGGYGDVKGDVLVTVTDNDFKGIAVNPASLNLDPGNSATYTVVLDTEPTDTVTVGVSSGDTGRATVSDGTADFDGTLTFTTANWSAAQTVTVSAPSDAASGTVTISNDATGGGYTGVSAAVSVSVTGANNAPVITNAPASALSVAENSASGTSLHTFTATDADGDTVTWSLEGTDAALFAISAGGELTTASVLNHEESASRSITVKASDGNDGEATASVTVNVTDVDTEAPGKPAAPTLTSATSESLTVGWTEPANTGPAITNYDVQYREGTTGSWTAHDHTGTAITASITGLTASTSYQVQVRATNAEGTGAWSDSLTASTSQASNSAPVIYYNGADAGANVTVQPDENSSPSYVFTAQDSDSGQTMTWTLTDATSTFQVDGGTVSLQSGANLNHEVQSSHSLTLAVDDGAGASDSVGITVEVQDVNEAPGKPAAAPTLDTNGATSTSLTVSWSAPSNTGPAITGYNVRYREGTTGAWTSHADTGPTTSRTITGLTASTSYQVQVQAVNDEGTGAWSDSLTASTTAVDPAAPDFGAATVDEQVWTVGTKITALTLPEATGGTGTLTYSLSPTLPGSGLSFDTSTRVLSGTPDTSQGKLTYTLTVTGSNGQTDTLSFGISILPATPTLTLTPGNGQVTLTWTTTNDPGIGSWYYAQKPQSDGNSDWSEYQEIVGSDASTRSHVVTGLTNGVSYQFEVIAETILGTGENVFSVRQDPRPSATPTDSATQTAPDFGSATVSNQTYTFGQEISILKLPEATGGDGELTYSLSPDVADIGLTLRLSGVKPDGTPAAPDISGTPTASQPATTYTYKVSDDDGDQTASDEDTLTFTIAVKPAKPATPAATPGHEQVTLTWIKSDDPGLDAYGIQQSADSGATWSQSTFSCLSLASSDPEAECTVTGLVNDTEYQFRVTAGTGSASGSPLQSEPSDTASATPKLTVAAPDRPTMRSLSSTSLLVLWLEPDNRGLDITGYDVQYKLASAPSWSDAGHSGTNKAAEITGLTEGAEYRVRVRAVSDEGKGTWSDRNAVAAPTAGCELTDYYCGTLTAGTSSDGSVIGVVRGGSSGNYGSLAPPYVDHNDNQYWLTGIQYEAGASSSTFRVALRDQDAMGGLDALTLYVSGQSFAFSDATHPGGSVNIGEWTVTEDVLADGTAYTVRIPAPAGGVPQFCDIYTGISCYTSWDAFLEENPDADDLDNPVVAVIARPPDTDQWITWSLAGGADAASFRAERSSPTSKRGGRVYPHPDATFDFESDKTLYQFLLVGVDESRRVNALPVEITILNDGAEPLAPLSLDVTAAFSTSLEVAWEQALSIAPPVTYDVQYRQAGQTPAADWVDWPHTGADTAEGRQAVITGLEEDTEYEVRVRGSNSDGKGPWLTITWSTASATDVPGAPTALTLTPSKTQIDVSWTAPVSHGGSAIDGYDVEYCRNSDGCDAASANWTGAAHSGTDASHAITGLASATEYAVRVRAGNANGGGEWVQATATTSACPDGWIWCAELTAAGDDAIIGFFAAYGSDTSSDFGTLTPREFDHDGATYEVFRLLNRTADGATQFYLDESQAVSGLGATYLHIHNVALALDDAAKTGNEAEWTSSDLVLTDGESYIVGLGPYPAAPGTLSTLSFSRLSAYSFNVSWDQADKGDGIWFVYDVEYCPSSTGCDAATDWVDAMHTGGSASHTITITGLEGGARYQVRVRAKNAAGIGGWIESSQWVGPPSFGSATMEDQVWTVGEDIGRVALPEAEGAAPTSNGLSGIPPGVSFSGNLALVGAPTKSQGTTATTLTAYDTGMSGLIDTLTFNISVLPAQAPAPALMAGINQVTLSWAKPLDTGIAGWQMQQDTGDWQGISPTGAAILTHTVTGLTNGTEYTFKIRAVAGSGTAAVYGAASGGVKAIPSAVAPGAPTDLTLTAGRKQLDASWTAPSSAGGSAITGYDVRYCNTETDCDEEADWKDAGHTGTDTAAAITELDNGVEYKVQVRAVNSVGASGWVGATATTLDCEAPWIWCAALTAGSGTLSGLETFGFNGTATVPSGDEFGSLTPQEFEYDGKTYMTTELRLVITGQPYLRLSLYSATGEIGDLDNLILHAGDATVNFADGNKQNSTTTSIWAVGRDTLVDGGNYTVGIAVPNRAPVITNAPLPGALPNVPENLPAGTRMFLHTFTATDADGDVVTWSLGGADADSFIIDAITGHLFSDATFDFENKSTYSVDVTASDGELTDTVTVTVSVQDEDEPPDAPAAPTVTAASSSSLSVSWTAPDNTGKPAITGYNVGYRETTRPGDWTIYTQSGTATTSTITGLKADTSYDVVVQAINDEGDGQWSAVGMGTTVAPPNLAPVIEGDDTVVITVAENTASGTDIGTVFSATDADGDSITWSLGGTYAGLFAISTVGQLSTASVLNYEVGPGRTFTVQASDGNGGTDSVRVNVMVTDDDTEAPGKPAAPTVIAASDTSFTVNWSAPANAGPTIHDYDVRYCDASGACDAATDVHWTVFQPDTADDSTDTSATITGLPASTEYQVQVRAENAEGTGAWSDSGTLRTCEPNWLLCAVLTAGEGEVYGTDVIGFSSKEYGQLSPAQFNFDGNTYDITTIMDVGSYIRFFLKGNQETADLAELTFHLDGAELEFADAVLERMSADWYGHIANLVEGSEYAVGIFKPNNAPVIGGADPVTITVAENTASGADIGTAFSATDADGDSITWSLEGTDAALFAISSGGQLSTASVLNYEDSASRTFTVQASDGKGGTDSVTVNVTVTDENTEAPGKPAAPTVTAESHTSLAVSWSAPANAGPDITGYNVQYRKSGAGSWTSHADTGPTTSRTITGLVASTSYDVQVQAVNDEGTGDWSDSGTGTTNAVPVENQAPTIGGGRSTIIVSAMENATGVIYTFSATDPDNDTITWTISGDDAAAFTIASKTDTTAELSTAVGATLDYDSGKIQYAFSVRANDGNGGEALAVVKVSVWDASPAAPAAPTVAAASDSSLDVSWTAPDRGTGKLLRLEPTGYDLRSCPTGGDCNSETGTDWTVHDHTGTATSATITGLTANTGYQVQVRAENAEGTGPWSPSGTGTTNEAPAQGNRVSLQGNTASEPSNSAPVITNAPAAALSVNENSASGANLHTFTATDADGDSIAWSLEGTDAGSFSISSGGQLSTASVLNYEDGASRTFTVKASDGNGGTDSVAVNVTVTDDDTEAPGQPTAPTVGAASHTSLSVSWNAPANTGPAISEYNVQYRVSTTGSWTAHAHTGTGTSTTITGLTASTSYDVQVRAINAEGTGDWSDSGTGSTNAAPEPSNSAPVIANAPAAALSVNENSASGANLHTFTATDADGDSIAWSLEGTDAGSFGIGAATGLLVTSTTFNHEQKPQYSFTVKASDGNGGTDSVAVAVNVADLAEPPGKPDAPTVETASTTSLKVSWSAPSNTGPAITGYDVRYRVGTSGSWTAHSYAGTAISATITGLATDTGYEVQVQAKNDEGTGAWSSSGMAITTPEVYFYPTSGDWVSGVVVRSGAEGCRNEDWIWSCLAEEEPDGNASMITLARGGTIWLGFTVASGDVPGTVKGVWFEVSMAANKDTIAVGDYGFTVFAESTEVAKVSGPQGVGEAYADVKVESADITGELSGSLNQAKIHIEAPASPNMQLTRVRMVVQYELE